MSFNRLGSDASFLIGQDDYLYKLLMAGNFDPLAKSNITKLDKALVGINRLKKETEPKKKKDTPYGKTSVPPNRSAKKQQGLPLRIQLRQIPTIKSGRTG